ncbi:hypothetical protein PhaeoP23_01062 [Phaeobacter piscinae]|uniref:Uncharacterized protein n=1 Tax=Phaeobacter piscinae TaxID=1580596 RepID=A0ABM6PC08_9RHOB|nr:hypothetical protein PhaeoP36_01062 [Phaeobacter piscinae]AUQ85736.1 hypothetical protein PhaeoP42_01062 [Phaeobacter piscinae]AUR23620.1 hypothetical protein PhaeoP23_01062 [Phaeobacter piscinae]
MAAQLRQRQKPQHMATHRGGRQGKADGTNISKGPAAHSDRICPLNTGLGEPRGTRSRLLRPHQWPNRLGIRGETRPANQSHPNDEAALICHRIQLDLPRPPRGVAPCLCSDGGHPQITQRPLKSGRSVPQGPRDRNDPDASGSTGPHIRQERKPYENAYSRRAQCSHSGPLRLL